MGRARRLWKRVTRRRRSEEVSEEWTAVTARAMSDMEARRAAVAPMAEVVREISGALYEADPVGVAGSGEDDEYDSEAETIVLRLAEERRLLSDADVLQIVHEEFRRWFGEDLAGPPARYAEVSERVSAAWRDFLASGA